MCIDYALHTVMACWTCTGTFADRHARAHVLCAHPLPELTVVTEEPFLTLAKPIAVLVRLWYADTALIRIGPSAVRET
jgi:hypothetical protein